MADESRRRRKGSYALWAVKGHRLFDRFPAAAAAGFNRHHAFGNAAAFHHDEVDEAEKFLTEPWVPEWEPRRNKDPFKTVVEKQHFFVKLLIVGAVLIVFGYGLWNVAVRAHKYFECYDQFNVSNSICVNATFFMGMVQNKIVWVHNFLMAEFLGVVVYAFTYIVGLLV